MDHKKTHQPFSEDTRQSSSFVQTPRDKGTRVSFTPHPAENIERSGAENEKPRAWRKANKFLETQRITTASGLLPPLSSHSRKQSPSLSTPRALLDPQKEAGNRNEVHITSADQSSGYTSCLLKTLSTFKNVVKHVLAFIELELTNENCIYGVSQKVHLSFPIRFYGVYLRYMQLEALIDGYNMK